MTAFLALLRRDLLVALAQAPASLLMATLTQPILVVLVFGNILPRLNLVADEFRTVMVPGLMSITMLMAGVQGVLMPLAADLSGTPRGGRTAAGAASRWRAWPSRRWWRGRSTRAWPASSPCPR